MSPHKGVIKNVWRALGVTRLRQALPKVALPVFYWPSRLHRRGLKFDCRFERVLETMVINSRQIPPQYRDSVRIVFVGDGIAELEAGSCEKCKRRRDFTRTWPIQLSGHRHDS